MYDLTLLSERQTVVGTTQKWRVHVPGKGNLDVDLFKGKDGKWVSWTGCYIRSAESRMAERVAETINWLEGNPI